MGIKGLAEEKAGCRARGSSAAAVTIAVDREAADASVANMQQCSEKTETNRNRCSLCRARVCRVHECETGCGLCKSGPMC